MRKIICVSQWTEQLYLQDMQKNFRNSAYADASYRRDRNRVNTI